MKWLDADFWMADGRAGKLMAEASVPAEVVAGGKIDGPPPPHKKKDVCHSGRRP